MAVNSNKEQESLFIVNAKDSYKYICFPLEETVFIKQKITLLMYQDVITYNYFFLV